MQLVLRDLVRLPGLISLSRVPLAAAFPLVLSRPGRAIGVLVVAGVSDLLDGWTARTLHEQSETGAVADGVTDKVFVLTVIGSLVAARRLSLVDVALLGTRELGELALAARLHGTLRHPAANAGGKLATTLQYFALGAVLLRHPLRRALTVAAGIAGVVASVAYWRREVGTSLVDRGA